MMNSAATMAFGLPTSLGLWWWKLSRQSLQCNRGDIPEEELAVEITDVNGIHVYDVNILETRQRQVCQDLAAQATSADHKNLAFISQKILYLLIA